MKKKVFTKSKIKNLIAWLIIIVVLILFFTFIGCPFKNIFGVCCPGCGMSRAVEAILSLDFTLAFQMHPLVFFLPVAAVIWLVRKKMPQKVFEGLLFAAAAVLFAVYFIRLFSGSEVVYIDFKEGLFYKYILGGG